MVYFGEHPPRAGKWAFSDRPLWKERNHFSSYNGSDHDTMSKRRLGSRAFGFVRHPVYRSSSLTEPARECPYYAPEDERLNADVAGYIKDVHEKARGREREILECRKADRAYQHYKLMTKREEIWEKSLERDEFMRKKPHGRVFANLSGVDYDIVTMEFRDGHAGRRVKYREDMARWRGALRKLFLQAKSTGCQNFNILNWRRAQPLEWPHKPAPPQPDPPVSPRPAKRYVPTLPKVIPVSPSEQQPGDGRLPEQLDYGPSREAAVQECKVKDVIVRVKHPWEHYS